MKGPSSTSLIDTVCSLFINNSIIKWGPFAITGMITLGTYIISTPESRFSEKESTRSLIIGIEFVLCLEIISLLNGDYLQ
jgi:hypothetical protein